ncbi:MAG: hypothetical protein MMC33_003241 [Icmadophila ericetorum]|nr:hypothetical protein [Icmadophila ericetorum]
MYRPSQLFHTLILLHFCVGHPTVKRSDSQSPISDPSFGPIPGQAEVYNDYLGKAPPFPANMSGPVPALANGPPGPDDPLFQTLLSAEWVIYSFYQSAVEAFNTSSFTALGLPNTTYDRICQIRDNEAGHLRIFQDSISATSLKPGTCNYTYPYTDAEGFLAIQVLIEVASQAFLTGLTMEAKLNASKGALVAVAEVETRHNTWALIDVWNANPFTGPADTVFPYANQILDTTKQFIVPGSCPTENPVYPNPDQSLPGLSFNANTTTGRPGANLTFTFPDGAPAYMEGQEYYAVYFHGIFNISVPFDTTTNVSTIPAEFDKKGIIIAVITDEPGAPTLDSVVAGPAILLEQPKTLTLEVLV